MRFGNPIWWTLLVLATAPVEADDLAIAAPRWGVGNAEFSLAGVGQANLFGGNSQGGVSGMLAAYPTLTRRYDSGLGLTLSGRIVAADPLSRGRYDGDAIEYLAAGLHTGLGKLEVGITDGAAYQVSILSPTDPVADVAIALADPRTTFFRDPSGRAVTRMFALRTQVAASSNYAKIAYVSPELFGLRLGLSFAPSEAKQLPFLNAGPHVAGRQADIWEAALKYEDSVGPVTLTGFAAIAEGRAERKLPGQEGVSDLSAGLRADYPVNDDLTLSLGGSFRQSNAYGFDINQSWQAGVTRAGHVSALARYDVWRASVEYGSGNADAVAGLPRLGLTGWEAALSRDLPGAMAVSAGWQSLHYSRGSGAFFNGAPQLKLDAVFLHLRVSTLD